MGCYLFLFVALHIIIQAYNWDLDSSSPVKRLKDKVNILRVKLKFPSSYRKCTIDIDGKEGHFFVGRAYIALTKGAAEYCVNFYDTHGEFNKRFRKVYASDESYFQTVLMNSLFAEKSYYELCEYGDDIRWYNLTYMQYNGEAVVQTDKSFFDKFRNSDFLFFRKANLTQSEELLDYIDSMTS